MAPQYPSIRRHDLCLEAVEESGSTAVRTKIKADWQVSYHEVAPVDTCLFGSTCMDPGFITMQINYSELRGMFAQEKGLRQQGTGKPNAASVHVSEEIHMHRGVRLGETITIRPSKPGARLPHRLGELSQTFYEGVDSTGKIVWELMREGITLRDTARDRLRPSAGATPARDARKGRTFVTAKTFSPEIVLGYLNDFDGLNPLHHDPEVAVAAGYRSPIWAGAQGIHICVEHLCRLAGGLPEQLHMSTKLLRPVCWDETVELWFCQAQGMTPGIGSYALLRATDHKPALELRVIDFTPPQEPCSRL